MKKVKLLGILIAFIFVFLVCGCGSDKIIAVTVHNLDGKTFELGEKIDLDSAFITVVYANGDKEDVSITHENVDMADLLNAYNSLGEKKINVYYKTEDNVYNEEVIIYIVEKEYKSDIKKQISEYNNDKEYSEDSLAELESLKVIYSNYINNTLNSEEANEVFEVFKKEANKVFTLSEEDNLYSLEEVSDKINDLESKLNIFINYSDSTIKDEIESLKEKVVYLENNLKDEKLYQEIESMKLTVSALQGTVNNIQNNVINNNEKINALTELLNSVLSQYVSKEELDNTISELTNSYLEAITKAFDSQKFISEIRVNEGYIEYRYHNANYFEKLIAIEELNGQSVSGLEVSENGTALLRLRNNNVITTNVSVDTLTNEELDEVNNSLNVQSVLNVREIICAYFNKQYNLNNYDCTNLEDVLDEYYSDYVVYVDLTNYDVLEDVKTILSEFAYFINNEFALDSDSYDELFSLEEKLKGIDTNLEVCKSFFATLLENQEINDDKKEAFKNRILTTKSIESVIMLYEEALN